MRTSPRVALTAAGASTVARARRSGLWIGAFDALLSFVGILVSLAWAGGIVRSEAVRTSGTNSSGVWFVWLGFCAGSVLHVAVHELGHLLSAVALRLPVVSVRVWHLRFGRPDEALAGTSGHVRVEVSPVMTRLPARMIMFAMAGPAANVVVALVTATTVVANRSAPTGLRTLAVGFAVAGFYVAIASLVPWRPTHAHETDGRATLQWIFHPSAERERLVGGGTLARQPGTPGLRGPDATQQRRDLLLSAIEHDHPDVAVAAMTELLRRRPRWDDGWQDFEVVATFAGRADVPAEMRAKVGGQYALSLALAHLVAPLRNQSIELEPPRVDRMERLAELALAADEESLQARTAVALVRVIQERPADAQALLREVASRASPAVQARAFAVRGIAELELGDLDQARESARLARRNAIDDSVVKLLHTKLAAKASL